MNELKASDAMLQEIIDEYVEKHGSDNYLVISLKELQSLRKIDIPYTLKYAEESAAAYEELKYGIDKVVADLRNMFSKCDPLIHIWQYQTMKLVLDLIEDNISEQKENNE